jgi:hypothetical protein
MHIPSFFRQEMRLETRGPAKIDDNNVLETSARGSVMNQGNHHRNIGETKASPSPEKCGE